MRSPSSGQVTSPSQEQSCRPKSKAAVPKAKLFTHPASAYRSYNWITERNVDVFLLLFSPLATPIHVVGKLTGVVREAQERQGAALLAVLNVTPDSFYDGALYQHVDRARHRIDQLLEEGADIIDVGPESTRPGSTPVSPREQLERAAPVITHAVQCGALVSIDTTNAEVARAALELGAHLVNDVSCLANPELAKVAARFEADLIIMHSRGSMANMAGFSAYAEHAYSDVVAEVQREWALAQRRALSEGLTMSRVWFDPGLGFHKSAQHSWTLLRQLEEFESLGAPMVVGPSRKSFLGTLDGSAPSGRLGGTIAACLRAVDAGASMLRVHDVHDVKQALLAHQSLRPSRQTEGAARVVA